MRTFKIAISTFILATLFLLKSLASQPEGISGQVENKGKGVPYVAVFIHGTQQGVSTDGNGKFQINDLMPGSYVLGIQGLGYKTTYHTIEFKGGHQRVHLNVESDSLLLPHVEISGARVGVLRYLPGSVALVSQQELKTQIPLSGNEVMRNISGLHVVEEEGVGLRMNLGVRGLDPDKSRNILVLEDGVPVALAPYGEPEMYYTPAIERMSGLEVLKGNGSILFGPQTIGGVVNYLTADAPETESFDVKISGGKGAFFNSRVSYGNSYGNTGVRINFLRKQANELGNLNFRLNDLSAKIQIKADKRSELGLKLGIYDETSDATYVGITQAMYDMGSYDFVKLAPDDKLDVRRYSTSLHHKYRLAEGLQLNTTAFAYTTTRNWNRQDFSYSKSTSNQTGVSFGDDSLPEGALYMRNSTGQRNRQFEVAGVEPRLSYRYQLNTTNGLLDAGARFMYERAFEQRVNGSKAGAISGNLREDEIRTGNAVSSFLQNKLIFSESVSATIGLRSENIWYERAIYRTAGKDTLIGSTTEVFALIPGAGLNYNISNKVGLFAGVHRGFAPPRIKDAISNEGEDLQLDAEKSWNYELGIRLASGLLTMETTAFYMDFSNQVIPVSESSGGQGAGYVNGGATTHAGIETGLELSFANFLPSQLKGLLKINATLTNSEFSSDRYLLQKISTQPTKDSVFVNVKGNKTPYAPSVLLGSSFMLEWKEQLGIRLSANYTGAQFTDALNTVNPMDWIQTAQNDPTYRYMQATASGRIGRLDPFFLLDASVWFKHEKSGIDFNASVKNILNERYIASRRPQGIRVGLPRFFCIGIGYSF